MKPQQAERLFNKQIRHIRIALLFYRTFVLFAIICSLACGTTLFINGLVVFKVIFWFKLVTLALTYYFINSYKSKEFVFYYNLGVSKRFLWAVACLADVAIFIICLIIAYNLRHAYIGN